MQKFVAQEWHRKKAGQKGKSIFPNTMPPLVFTYQMGLVWQAAIDVERTGRYPTPEEVAGRDAAWQEDINKMLEWLGFIRGKFGDAT